MVSYLCLDVNESRHELSIDLDSKDISQHAVTYRGVVVPTRFELVTSTVSRCCSTTELRN